LEQIIPVLVGEWQAVGRFDSVLDLLRKPPGDQLPQKDQLQQEVLTAWLSKGDGELAAQEFANAEKIAQDILDRFRGNGPATRLRKDAIAGSVAQAINSNRFSDALVILSGRGQILEGALKKKLQEDLRTVWRKQVDQEPNADRAIAIAGDFLNAFPGDKKVMEKRDEARARKAVKSIEDLQKADD